MLAWQASPAGDAIRATNRKSDHIHCIAMCSAEVWAEVALEAAVLPCLPLHGLRYTCATLLLGQGVHPRLMIEILGHSQIAFTMKTYMLAMRQEVASQMDQTLRPLATAATSTETGKPK